MKILALETASQPGSLALLEDEQVVSYVPLASDRRTAETFALAVQIALQQQGWTPRQLELLAMCRGPGSFTGLRIGITAAKTWGYATGAAVLGLNTLEVVAHQATGSHARLWVVLDAYRKQLFAAPYRVDAQGVTPLEPTQIVSYDALLERLTPDSAITGSGLRRLLDRLPAQIPVLEDKTWSPRADTLGRLALQRYRQGARDDIWKLAPEYLRPSAAEEKWDQRKP